MGPSRGDTICADVVIEAIGPMNFGARALGPIHIARTPAEPKLWLSTIERTLLPKSADVSRFMAGVGELARLPVPGAVPLVLVDREADFCVVGYRAIEDGITVGQLAEQGPDPEAAAQLAVALARTLAELHRRGFVHGLVTSSTVLRAGSTWWTWQHGIAGMCVPDRLAPRLRPLGGDPVAPELRAGAGVSPAADVFGWGAVVACLLTGATGSEAINLVLEEEHGDPLFALVRACLEAMPELRPRDGAQLLVRLQSAVPPELAPSDSMEASFADLNDGDAATSTSSGSRFGLPGDPEPSPPTKRPPPPPPERGAKPDALASTRDASIVELLVLGPDDQLDEVSVAQQPPGPPPPPSGAPVAVPAGQGGSDDSWRDLAVQYLSEHPPTREEVDALPVQELVVPPPGGGDRRGALGRVALIRTRVRTGPQRPVQTDASSASGTFEMADEPEPEPREPPPFADDAPELPLGSDEDEPWDDPDAAVYDLDGPDGPRRVGEDDEDEDDDEVDIDWPSGETAPVDPRGATWPATATPPPTHKLGADDDTPAHPTPLAWLSPEPGAPAESHAAPHSPRSPATKQAPVDAPAVVVARSASLELPLAAPPKVRDDVPLPAGRTTKPVPVVAPERSATAAPVVVAVAKPAAVAKPVAVPKPAVVAKTTAPKLERPVRARRGTGLALGFVAITGALAIAATLALAKHRGGISQLLAGGASPPPAAEPTSEAAVMPVEPTPPKPEPPKPEPAPVVPTTCPDAMRPIDATACIDRGEFPGLAEIPRTQVALEEARTACAERGARLCSTQEWRRACKGPSNWRHPYGARAELDRCNGASPSGAIQDLSRSGARDACVTEAGVFDLEGNVAEWVDEGAVLGGDSATRGASCDTRNKPAAGTRSPTTGFRCCLSLAHG